MLDEFKFPTELKLWKYELERRALRFGLTLVPVSYTIVNFDEMSEIAATGGFPVTIPHWRNGQNSIHFKKRYKYGMQHIMELVINTNPARAYLHETNTITTQKAVMAHVNGHVDIFTRNAYFKPTNRDMINAMEDDRALFEKLISDYGERKVKKLYDFLLSFESCIDANSLYTKREEAFKSESELEKEEKLRKVPKRIPVPEGLPESFDKWLNPVEWIEDQKKQIEEKEKRKGEVEKGLVIPERPMRDILEFLKRYAPLQKFEVALIDIAQRHSYYFAPQARTKLLHEGWATLVEEQIMSEAGVMKDSEYINFSEVLAAVQRGRKKGINPYRLGYELLMDIWLRWDTGRHGEIWEKCDSVFIKEHWDEFAIFKNIFEKCERDIIEFAKRWREFSAFYDALRRGELGVPKEFFTCDMLINQYLILSWLKYENVDTEFNAMEKRFNDMLPIEEKAKEQFQVLLSENSGVSTELLFGKARKDVYYAYGRGDLYLWTQHEVEVELNVLKKFLSFKKGFSGENVIVESLSILPDWIEYAKKFAGEISLGKGKEKLFEVTESYDDLMILDEFFTKEFCLKHKYFLYKAKPVWNWDLYPDYKEEHYFLENRSFERIKQFLLFQYTNAFNPVIDVQDGNYENKGELYLVHHHNGVDLEWEESEIHIEDVLERLYSIWGKRAVHLLTIRADVPDERPFWFDWHSTADASTSNEPEEVTGEVVLCSWGPHGEKNKVGYYEEIMDQIKFKAPF